MDLLGKAKSQSIYICFLIIYVKNLLNINSTNKVFKKNFSSVLCAIECSRQVVQLSVASYTYSSTTFLVCSRVQQTSSSTIRRQLYLQFNYFSCVLESAADKQFNYSYLVIPIFQLLFLCAREYSRQVVQLSVASNTYSSTTFLVCSRVQQTSS